MKRLIVMRHAKSSWSEPGLEDHQRPLNKRGKRDAPRIAARLLELGWSAEQVVSSDSQRTRQTWALMAPVWAKAAPQNITFTRALYLAGPFEIDKVVRQLPQSVHSVLLLGHNPGWESSIGWLSGQHQPMTTANAALLSIDRPTWASALDDAGQWTLHQVVRPKELDD